LFLLESFEWLHQWHGHDEARRVADSSVGILFREGKRELWRVRHANRGEDHSTIPIRGVYLNLHT
jgi:hypothetical protein